jgi:hypothetical protein
MPAVGRWRGHGGLPARRTACRHPRDHGVPCCWRSDTLCVLIVLQTALLADVWTADALKSD